MRFVLATLLLSLFACTSSPTCTGGSTCPPCPTCTSPDAGTATVEGACATLARLACAEGNASCPASMHQILNARVTAIDVGCIENATSKAAVRACGPSTPCP